MDGHDLEKADKGLDLEKALGDILARLDRIEEKVGLRPKKYEIHVAVDYASKNGIVRPFYVFGIFLEGREIKLARFIMPETASSIRCMLAGIHESYQYAYLAGAKQVALYINFADVALAYSSQKSSLYDESLNELWQELKQELGNAFLDYKSVDQMFLPVVEEVKRIKTEQ